jgi:DNA ligase-associated metallophosphoesterase
MVTTDVGGQRLALLPEKAAWWPAQQALLVADAHLGKAVSFRRLGVPVPEATTGETLSRLTELVERHGARRIVFLGDFLHSVHAHANSTLDALARWRERHADLHLTLVRGNHDAHAGDPPAWARMEVVDEPLLLGGLALCHHPVPRDGAYVLAGHLHPGIVLGGRPHDHLRLPCFWFGERVGVLPAFGAFTGLKTIRPAAGDRVFALAEQAVLPVPSPPPAAQEPG